VIVSAASDATVYAPASLGNSTSQYNDGQYFSTFMLSLHLVRILLVECNIILPFLSATLTLVPEQFASNSDA